MEESLMQEIANRFELTQMEPNLVSPLVLAYIGDAFYELIIRTKVVLGRQGQVHKLHKQSANLVKASAQAALMERIKVLLSEEELRIFKRGRNAHAHSVAKNSTIKDYRNATGFEALMGYLYLSRKIERAIDLVKLGVDMVKQEDGR